MSTIAPVVRHMLLCREVRREATPGGGVNLYGVFATVNAGTAAYPLPLPDAAVFLMLTGGRGEGMTRIVIRDADTDEAVHEGPEGRFTCHADPLRVRPLVILLRDVTIPKPGLYWVQFCYDGEVIAQEPLTIR
ncbi:MAG: hypothetical protein L0Z62_47470 [Gemmataceae bacterium]|nr:hypothetical protein [Gemmataceae bacterium]